MGEESKKAQERVKEIILKHKGFDNAISSREINEEIDVDNVGSFPGTRQIIRTLIIDEEIPIASSGNGYYVVETEEELAEYLESLEGRMLSIADRKWAIQRAAVNWEEDIESSEDRDLL
ncbi:hypothetical protein [Halomontanus rarus]|uniref:hypothetical protein n=1 Tax=Halomontanus rarus TaxID=3034020 RepID=UPI0023E807D2|nr:hypothetical protein [Halovivax sp. TS33]